MGLVLLLPLLGAHAADLRAQDAIARVAADDERAVDLAVGNRAARVADERLLQHAYRREQRHGAIGADGARDLAARVLVAPAALRHADASDTREELCRLGRRIRRRVAYGGEHEVERLHRPRGIVFALRRDADADEHRRVHCMRSTCCQATSAITRARRPTSAAPASADVPISARFAIPCMMAASLNMLKTTQNSQSCAIDALASRARAIAVDVLALAGNAQGGQILAGHAAELLLRQAPDHRVIREVGERMAERGQLPIEDRDDTRLDAMHDQVVEPEVAVNDRARIVRDDVARQPVDQPVHRVDGLRFRRAILLRPAPDLALEIVARLAVVAEADGPEVHVVQPRDHRVDVVPQRGAFRRVELRQRRVPEMAAVGKFHDEERRADDAAIVAVAIGARHRHVGLAERRDHAVFAIDGVRRRQELAFRLLAQHVRAAVRAQPERRIGLPAAQGLDRDRARDLRHVLAQVGGECRFVQHHLTR